MDHGTKEANLQNRLEDKKELKPSREEQEKGRALQREKASLDLVSERLRLDLAELRARQSRLSTAAQNLTDLPAVERLSGRVVRKGTGIQPSSLK